MVIKKEFLVGILIEFYGHLDQKILILNMAATRGRNLTEKYENLIEGEIICGTLGH